MNPKAPYVLIVCISLFCNDICGVTSNVTDAGNNDSKRGYKSIISYKDGFIATGPDGRFDRISKSGDIIQSEKVSDNELKCLLSYEQTIVAAGEKGSFFISSDGSVFKKIDIKTNNNINSLASFQGYIIAGADGGELLIGDESGFFKILQLDLKGNIVSVSAGTTVCYGVTDEGEILHTNDGFNWSIFNFNEFYSGYYKPCRFTCIFVTENMIMVAGKNHDNMPVMMFSIQGNVWSERNLEYTDDKGNFLCLQEMPNDIIYDLPEDRFLLVCNKGKVMSIPSCSHCNKLVGLATDENLTGIANNGGVMVVVGDSGYIKRIKL